jgi:hypothetical protein
VYKRQIQEQSPTTSSDLDELILKLQEKKSEAIITRNQASDTANTLATEASKLQDELRTVSTVLT